MKMPLRWFKNVKKVAVRINSPLKKRAFFLVLAWSDVAETISEFYSNTTHVKPPPKTVLSNYDIDAYLNELGRLTREQDQIQLLRQITEKSTVNDLRMFIRLVQKDLVNIRTLLFLEIPLFADLENQCRTETYCRKSWCQCLWQFSSIEWFKIIYQALFRT